ncbi:MAG: hypothetical protein WCV50_06530 [Patescibacteria group bacterium]|jgi:hypothetical protein
MEPIRSIVVSGEEVAFPEVGAMPKAPEIKVLPGEYPAEVIANPGGKQLQPFVIINVAGKKLGMTEAGWMTRANRPGAGFSLTLPNITSIGILKAEIALPVVRWVLASGEAKKDAAVVFCPREAAYTAIYESDPGGAEKPQLVTIEDLVTSADKPNERVTVGMTALEWFLRARGNPKILLAY